MSNLRLGPASRECVLGLIVRTGAQTFPQTATATLFTVHTGNVLVTAMYGIITTLPGGDPQITMGLAPTAGTAEVNGLGATTAITEEVGSWVALYDTTTTNKAGAFAVGGHAGVGVFGALAAFPVAPGAITGTASASQTGAMQWYLTYVPLDEGAYVGALTG